MDRISVNSTEYSIIKLLGKGKGGYSYLATDGNCEYTLKQIHHEPCSYYKFGNKIESELSDYGKLSKIGIRMPELVDVDIQNEIILKEYIDGPTINQIIDRYEMKNSYYDQIDKMCELLYANNTNIDYYPTNFIVCNELLYYIDYECNEYLDEWNFESWGIKYWSQTPEYMEAFHKGKTAED